MAPLFPAKALVRTAGAAESGMDRALHVTVLVEDTATRRGVEPRHGLALMVEHGESRVLFDTGPDGAVVANAHALGVELCPLTAIVLTHGHYDHTGGLAAVLAEAGPVRVIAHPAAWEKTFADDAPGGLRYLGTPLSRAQYQEQGASFELSARPVMVGQGLLTTGEVPQVVSAGASDRRLLRHRRGRLQADDFRDDISLVALLQDCSAVMTGCAHAGLLNILRQAEVLAAGLPPRVVLGGLHLLTTSDEAVAEIATETYARGVRTLLPCHCTGERAAQVLQAEFPGAVIPINTGMQIRIDQDGVPTLTSCWRANQKSI